MLMLFYIGLYIKMWYYLWSFFYFKKEKLLQILIDYYFIYTLVLSVWRKIIYKSMFIKKEKPKRIKYISDYSPFEKSKLMVFSLWLYSMYIDYMKSEYYIDSTFGLFGKHFAHREPIHNIRSRRKIYNQTIA